MKKRLGFVSNSSSASFIVNAKRLTEEQIDKIVNHIKWAKKTNFPDKIGEEVSESDEWAVYYEEGDSHISGKCSMDNFNMRDFLLYIGVHPNDIEYEVNG